MAIPREYPHKMNGLHAVVHVAQLSVLASLKQQKEGTATLLVLSLLTAILEKSIEKATSS